jgi:hypothetical protein
MGASTTLPQIPATYMAMIYDEPGPNLTKSSGARDPIARPRSSLGENVSPMFWSPFPSLFGTPLGNFAQTFC